MNELPIQTPEERLSVFNTLTSGCQHLWSKNKMQVDKVTDVLKEFYNIAQKDPLFLAHLTAWAMKQDSKDMKVVTIYANSLNAGDGLPFTKTSDLRKPNLRMVSQICTQELDPKLVLRLKLLGMLKWQSDGLNLGTHFPTALRTAIVKYIRLREKNTAIMRGIQRAGLRTTMINLYKLMHLRPADIACEILRWNQKDRKIKKEEALTFKGMSNKQIAEKIRKDKIPVLRAIGALKEVTPQIAVVLLENSKGDEPTILRKIFDESGVLQDKEVNALYLEKIRKSPSFERVEKASKVASEAVKEAMTKVKSVKKKDSFAETGIKKVALYIDRSGSMRQAIELAKEFGSSIAEMVPDPKTGFFWGTFNDRFQEKDIPEEFTEAGFSKALWGVGSNGMTDMFAGFKEGCKFGAEVHIWISDCQHNIGDPLVKIQEGLKIHKPNAVVLVRVGGGGYSERGIQEIFERESIPCAIVNESTLKSSSLIMQSIKIAVRGKIAIIDEIMNTRLPTFPDWWFSV